MTTVATVTTAKYCYSHVLEFFLISNAPVNLFYRGEHWTDMRCM